MQQYSFTNLCRELDRGTIYYADHILKPLAEGGVSDGDLLAITTAYRLFNKVATWQACFGPRQTRKWDWGECEHGLRERAEVEPVFTSATMVCAYDGKPGRGKIERVYLMLGAAFRDRERHARELKTTNTLSEALGASNRAPRHRSASRLRDLFRPNLHRRPLLQMGRRCVG
jgi:hypothetical protein